MAGRFLCLHGREISRLGAWRECQQNRQKTHSYKAVKQAVNLSKEARQIEKVLDEIGTFNSSKKKAEALALLKKWFPQMENFSGQLKKYQVTIDDLLAENTKLEERAKASEKGKMSNTIERAKLESELNELQRVIDRIPPDVLAQLKQEAKHHHRSR